MKKKMWYGWFLVPVCWLIYFINVGFPMYGDVIANAVMVTDLGIDRAVYGIGSSIYNMCVGLLGPVAGFLMAKHGCRFSFYLGSAMLMVSSFLLATWVDCGWKFILVYGVLSGNASLFAASLTCDFLICQWHKRRRGIALGLVATAAGMGSLIASPIVAFMCNSFGWRSCWLLVSVLSLFCLITERVFIVNKPEDIGQVVDGYKDPKVFTKIKVKKVEGSKIYRTEEEWGYKEIIKHPTTFFLLASVMSYYCAYVLIMSHGVLLLLEKGFDVTNTASMLAAVGVAGLTGRILCGYISDKIEPRWGLFVTVLLTLCGVYLLLVAPNMLQVGCAGAMVGFGFGGSFVLVPNIISNYFGAENYSKVYGTILPVVTIVSGLVPSFAGLLFDMNGNYQLAFTIVIAFALICFIGIFFAKPPKKKVLASVSK